MLEIFATKLDATQQRVYLAKNRLAQETAGLSHVPAFQPFRSLFQGLNDELDGTRKPRAGPRSPRASRSTRRPPSASTSARSTSCSARPLRPIFGLNITSNYVKRVLDQLRLVVEAKDLRIRGATGDGLPRLVEKWEVALRFVLNHERALA